MIVKVLTSLRKGKTPLRRVVKALFLTLGLFLVSGTAIADPDLLIKVETDVDDNPVIMADIITTLNKVAIEYPEVRGITLTTGIMRNGAYAYSTSSMKIVFNDAYTSSPYLIQEMIENDVAYHWHPPLGECTGAEFLAYHEAAHIIDFSHHNVAKKIVEQRLGDGTMLHWILSGYSFKEDGTLNVTEALAEAFAAVKCNGGNGTEQELFKILTE